MIEERFVELIAGQTRIRPEQAAAAICLFDKGATVPFVARYGKDLTGNLVEGKLERIEEQNTQFIAFTNRRDAILENIGNAGELTNELRDKLERVASETELEDLYLPFKRKGRVKSDGAKKQPLEALADLLWQQASGDVSFDEVVAGFVGPEGAAATAEQALEGARFILAERIAFDTEARAAVRKHMMDMGRLVVTAAKGCDSADSNRLERPPVRGGRADGRTHKFASYYDYNGSVKAIRPHHALNILWGGRVGAFHLEIHIDEKPLIDALVGLYITSDEGSFIDQMRLAAQEAYGRLLKPAIEQEVLGALRTRAEDETIRLLRENARNLLLAPPVGRVMTLGIEPGLRTGCKMAVVCGSGALVESATMFLSPPHDDLESAERMLTGLFDRNPIGAVAIGNGDGAREARRFTNRILRRIGKEQLFAAFVNESGTPVHAASKTACAEFPDLDIPFRAAVSIARRLQDPLAELVKFEPRTIGIGQNLREINQRRLREVLFRTVEMCVNRVGVDLNSATPELLRYVAGIQMGTAQNIVEFRANAKGFTSREQLREVAGIGEKTFQQCAGFLRVNGGDNALDATRIHPEAYAVVGRIAESVGLSVVELLENSAIVKTLDLSKFATETIGEHTLEDIRKELLWPGRDPRKPFRRPKFVESVSDFADLKEGMESEGVVTNITEFGAFVDIGVNQDGLVHRSELANRYVQHPSQIVRMGQIVHVKVIKVDEGSRRVSLSMKSAVPEAKNGPHPRRRESGHERQAVPKQRTQEPAETGRKEARRSEPVRREARPPEARRRETRKPEAGRKDARQQRAAHKRPVRKPDRAASPMKYQRPDEVVGTSLADHLKGLKEKLSKS